MQTTLTTTSRPTRIGAMWRLAVLGTLAGGLLLAGQSLGAQQTRRHTGHAVSAAHSTGTKGAEARDAELRERILGFIDRTMGWQGLDSSQVKSISAPDESGLRLVTVVLKKGEQSVQQTFYVTADGRKILQGEVMDLSPDPWRDTRAKLKLTGFPSEGPERAPVTLVEFSDLECPFCKQASQSIQDAFNQLGGKLRVVFKYYPLTSIHPWSMPAALAGACVARQSAADFWPFAEATFAHQDELTVATAPARLRDFALESGANGAAYDACLKDPGTQAAVAASMANGKMVGVDSTPTLFINGRKIEGAIDTQRLVMLLRHEAQVAPKYDAGALALNTEIKGEQCGQCGTLPPLPAKH